MLFIGKIGINQQLLFAQIINFLLLLGLLKKILLNLILKSINQEKKKIANEEKKLEEIRVYSEKLIKKSKNEVKHAQDQAGKIIVEAEKVAQRIIDHSKLTAAEEKKQVSDQIQAYLDQVYKSDDS